MGLHCGATLLLCSLKKGTRVGEKRRIAWRGGEREEERGGVSARHAVQEVLKAMV